MDCNSILAKMRYILDYNDEEMAGIFALAGMTASSEQVSNWLRKDFDPLFEEADDEVLAVFLNGLIIKKRGKQEGPARVPEKILNNNIVFRKLKIAFNMQADDILNIMASAGFPISKNELSSFFRRADHKHYRPCLDQYLRTFLKGLQIKYRGEAANEA